MKHTEFNKFNLHSMHCKTYLFEITNIMKDTIKFLKIFSISLQEYIMCVDMDVFLNIIMS